jgi:hypothetical protein
MCSRRRIALAGCNDITGGSGFSCGAGQVASLFRIYPIGDGMAKRTSTVFIDDLDGSEAEATVRFDLDGTSYEIDLNAAHARELRDTLARYTAAGRRAKSARNVKRTTVTSVNSSEVRSWARANGLEVADRGRLSADMTAKYRAATGK